MVKKFLSYILVLLMSLIVISCVAEIDPLTGQKIYTILSTEQEIKIGHQVIPYAINEYEGSYPDKDVQDNIRELGNHLVRVTPRRVDYQFFVLNTSQVNAFALPGGPVIITRGLLDIMQTENELIGVIAHELGHINARHHANHLERSYKISALIGILGITLQDSKHAGAIIDLARISTGLLQLKHSREEEHQADELGVRFSYEGGYNPKGLLSMFEKFKSLSRNNTIEWLSTHPLPETRIQNVRHLIASRYPDSDRLLKDSSRFHKIKGYISETKESYEYVEKAKKHIISHDYSKAIQLLDRAVRSYPQNQMAYYYRALAYLNLKRYDYSINDAEKAIQIDSLYFNPQLLKGIALAKIFQWQGCINTLERAKNLIADNPDLYYYLGVSYHETKNRQKAIDNLNLALKLSDGKRGWEFDAQQRLRSLN